ncbi:membrane protein required for colicin V production [Ulvibacter sp. MAR_2010_11]|uniref:CvpA family protein n=1 Tax=Ulvibacter sp. MAR_2010_11 TaxID=1250229 RepID=UPI000C2C9383|nr:CvpA family protein [Ulvibacter sp. MAR_2010_11]PKA83046.1 membrane protein required for colicin V production [Ulvibacter sp. MAR_2010_11]
MNTVDIALGIILLIGFYAGFKNGLFVSLASLIGLIAGAYGALYFSSYAGGFISKWFDWSAQTSQLVGFAVTFVIILFLISMAGKLLTRIADFAMLGIINKLLGGVFNAITYAFIISVVFMFVNASSTLSGYVISEEKKAESYLYAPVASLAPIVLPHILKEVDRIETEKDEAEEIPE